MVSSAAGLASSGTHLYYANHGDVAFKEVANVKTTPEVGSTPQQIEITNLGDDNQRYDLGMGSIPMLAFTVIYKGPDWNEIYAKAGNHVDYDWKLVYPDGMYITFTGPFDLQLQSLDVNTAVMYNLNISPNDVPRFHKSASDDGTQNENGGGAMSYRPMFVKTFASVEEMNAYDDVNEDVIQGDFVLINSEDSDRGKVYFFNGTGFTFFANIIGPKGFKGDKGDPGLDMRMLGKEDSLPAIADEGSFCFVGTTLYSYTNGKWIDLGDFQGDKGDKGDSAYTQAVEKGFKGTEEEWLASLKGDKGDSAYTQAVDKGYTGTEEKWLASLKGDKGDKGDSAYAQAVANGFKGTETEWIASLKGEPGEVSLADLNAGLGTKADKIGDNEFKGKNQFDVDPVNANGSSYVSNDMLAPNLIDVATDDWQTASWNSGEVFYYNFVSGHTYTFTADIQSPSTSRITLFVWTDYKNQTLLKGYTTPTAIAKGTAGTLVEIFTATETATAYVDVGAIDTQDTFKFRHVVLTESAHQISYEQAQANRHGFDGVDKTQDLIGGRNYVLNTANSVTKTTTKATGVLVGIWNLSKDLRSVPATTPMTVSFDMTVTNADSGAGYIGFTGPWTVFDTARTYVNGTTHVTLPVTQDARSVLTKAFQLEMTMDNSTATYTVANLRLNLGTFEHEWSSAPEDKVTDNHDGSITVNNASYNIASLVSRITALEAKVK